VLSLEISLKELFDFLKNNKILPAVDVDLEKNTLSFNIPLKKRPGIPACIFINFTTHSVKLIINSDKTKSLLSIELMLKELIELLKQNLKFPDFIKGLEYSDNKGSINLFISKDNSLIKTKKPLPVSIGYHIEIKLFSTEKIFLQASPIYS
jgi:hypothetical protein